jgi:hypothetical protein
LGGSGGGEYFKSKGYESNPQTEYKLRKNIWSDFEKTEDSELRKEHPNVLLHAKNWSIRINLISKISFNLLETEFF